MISSYSHQKKMWDGGKVQRHGGMVLQKSSSADSYKTSEHTANSSQHFWLLQMQKYQRGSFQLVNIFKQANVLYVTCMSLIIVPQQQTMLSTERSHQKSAYLGCSVEGLMIPWDFPSIRCQLRLFIFYLIFIQKTEKHQIPGEMWDVLYRNVWQIFQHTAQC